MKDVLSIRELSKEKKELINLLIAYVKNPKNRSRFEPKAFKRLSEMHKEGKITREEYWKLWDKEFKDMKNWRELKEKYRKWWKENKGRVKVRWSAAWIER
jgi:hypothetical protein